METNDALKHVRRFASVVAKALTKGNIANCLDDIVQEALLRLLRHEKFMEAVATSTDADDIIADYRGLIRRCVKCEWMDRLKKRSAKSYLTGVSDDSAAGRADPDAEEPLATMISKENRALALEVVEMLLAETFKIDPEGTMIFVMASAPDKVPTKVIAEIFETTESAIRSKVKRFKERAVKLLDQI